MRVGEQVALSDYDGLANGGTFQVLVISTYYTGCSAGRFDAAEWGQIAETLTAEYPGQVAFLTSLKGSSSCEAWGDRYFGATSDSLARARTVGFTIPYAIYYAQGVVNTESGISSFEDIRGKRVAAAIGTVPEQEWLKIAAEWGEEHLYQGYQSENEVFLAVAQGKADIGLTTNTAVKPVTDQYETLEPGPRMPWTTDYTSVVAKREDVTWLNFLNLFVPHQVRSGRYAELWGKYVGGEAPELRIPGVMY